MLVIIHLLGATVVNLFRLRRRLEVENLFLRHQLNIALRRAPHRLRLRRSDRVLLVWTTWLSVPKIRFGNIGGEVHRELAVK
jgi:hypothetical protein